MTQTAVFLTSIRLDEGTQVRAAISAAVVADYAEQMAEGSVFPPIVVFVDEDGKYHLADGNHRYLAAQRRGLTALLADVHPGTREDALWFALGANRTNGQRLTDVDKTHAVQLALATWPTRLSREIADQVGCSPSLVSKVIKDAATNTGGVRELRGRALVVSQKRETVRAMVLEGHQSIAIKKAVHVSHDMVADVRRELGLSTIDYSRAGKTARRERMRVLATEGHTSRQIAAELKMTEPACRRILRIENISVPGDDVTHHTRRPESNRIMERIVADAEDLSAGANLIDFNALDPTRIPDWMTKLRDARAVISMFMKRLQEKSNGEAA